MPDDCMLQAGLLKMAERVVDSVDRSHHPLPVSKFHYFRHGPLRASVGSGPVRKRIAAF